jgi:cytochrome c2
MKKAAMASVSTAIIILCAAAFSLDASMEHGKEVYETQKCGLCHSISGGGGKRLTLDGVGSKLSSDEIKKWIRAPKEMKANTTMKPYPNLPDKDLNDLTSYLLSLK